MVEPDGVTPGERSQDFGKLGASRGHRSVDQDRNDSNITVKRGSDFQHDQIVRIIQPPPPLLIDRAQPGLADQCEQDVTFGNRSFDSDAEVEARLNRVNIHKDVVGPEPLGQMIEQATRYMPAVFATIAHEDPYSGRSDHLIHASFSPPSAAARTLPAFAGSLGQDLSPRGPS
jgi:hypothetical protein